MCTVKVIHQNAGSKRRRNKAREMGANILLEVR